MQNSATNADVASNIVVEETVALETLFFKERKSEALETKFLSHLLDQEEI